MPRPPKGFTAAARNIAQHFGQAKGSIAARNNRKMAKVRKPKDKGC